MANSAHDKASMEAGLDATMQGNGGQRLEFHSDDDGPDDADEVPVGRPQTLDDVFDAWFHGFNYGADGARALPRSGYVSLVDAMERLSAFNEHNAVGATVRIEDVLEHCDCHSRHMHAGTTTLDPQWTTHPSYLVDFARGRARLKESSDNPQNWFAVEVNEQLFESYLTGVLRAALPPTEPQPYARPEAPPASAPRQVDAQPQGGGDLLPAGESDLCPTGGYRVVLTPAGFVPVWYGRPSRSEAEAVADAWRHDEGRKR